MLATAVQQVGRCNYHRDTEISLLHQNDAPRYQYNAQNIGKLGAEFLLHKNLPNKK